MSGSDLRADAARNRDAVLDAADRLFGEGAGDGVGDAVTMNAVAAAAGVGKGTVFRAFGDRTGLLRALLVRRSAELVAAVESGAPPFGADPDPATRVSALLDALLTFKLANRPLSLALDRVGSGSPYQAENYGWWHDALVDALQPGVGPDAGFLADALLAAVRSDLIEHLLTVRGRSEAQLRAGVADLAQRVLRR